MRHFFTSFFSLIFLNIGYSQIKGRITDNQNNPLPAVTIYIENSYINTTSNEEGYYNLPIKKKGAYTVFYQMLGFKTHKTTINVTEFPHEYNVTLKEENYILNEVVVSTKEDPAKQIIRKAISSKKINSEKTAKYKADFYSKGLMRIKDAPKKILGQDIGDFDGALDSTRTGIIYLSETVSKLVFQKPDKMKETILASKVAGKDNGFSFNNAGSVEFDFYENYLPFQVNVVSPIADNALNYYKYKIEGTFETENKQTINKIKVIPRRNTEPVFTGYIYIVEDSWAIYGLDLTINGSQMQVPVMDNLVIKQDFAYNQKDDIWTRNTQTIDFIAGMMGINVSGRFSYVYSNFEFEPTINKKTFTKEVLTFESNSNKMTDDYWKTMRPIPLTDEEKVDYVKKDSIQTLRKSQKYLDSIDAKDNKFKITHLLTGHTHKNSFKNSSLSYKSPLTSINFNTVQGYNLSSGFTYLKENKDNRTSTNADLTANYGFDEKKWRFNASYEQKFNNTNDATLTIKAGNELVQFNENKPISAIVNSISTLFFKNNFMKLYDKNFVKASYSQELFNGFSGTLYTDYSERNPVLNHTDYTIIKKNKLYTSNNPLVPLVDLPSFEKHNLFKFGIETKLSFAQEYWTRPDGKFNIQNEKYPVVYFYADKGIGNQSKYSFTHVASRIRYDLNLKNKGEIGINTTLGKFFDAKNISFVDYKHFIGNQTHIGQSDQYLRHLNLMTYYTNSTNDSYFEFHSEYDDKGYFTNKIPLISLLKANMILGFHNLAIPKRNPYQEYSIGLDNLGFGKYKIFRLDYVKSFQHRSSNDGIVFGLKILNVLN